MMMAEVGVYRAPAQFTDVALKLEHPFDGSSSVPHDVKRAIFWLLTAGPEEVAKQQSAIFDHYTEVSKLLEPNERVIHDNLDPEREAIICYKKIFLFKQLCEDAGVDDEGLLDTLVNGVKLTGTGETGQFEADIKEHSTSNVQ